MRSITVSVLALCLAAPTTAGSITGRVSVSRLRASDVSFRPYAGRASSLPAPRQPLRGLVTDAIVYVEQAPPGAALPSGNAGAQLAQRDQAFDPRVVVVSAGGSVGFPNYDRIYHNVFSVSPLRRFDLGKYPRGQSRTVRFPEPGVVKVFCDIHADMAGFILVTPSGAWARATRDGRYELSGLEPGHYRVGWWHPDAPGGSAEVDVPADGAVTLDVEL